jgi:hypothetical protein
MTHDYDDVWAAMNDLSMCQSGLDELKVLLSTTMDSFNDDFPGRSETDQLLSATYRFMNYFMDEHTEKFDKAWEVTISVGKELQSVKAELSRLKNPENPQYTEEELDAMCQDFDKWRKDRVTKWVLPVEQFAGSDEYLISFPDDLLKAANLKEGDQVQWIERGDGSFILQKVQ